jgi:RNA polymerase sigma-70 factor, ECF subfamily
MHWVDNLFGSLAAVTDEQAMWRVQMHDDPAAFAELFRRWEAPIRRLCLRMTGDEHRGEDLAQEAFVRVHAHRTRFRQGAKFSTWLWRIALNLCHDELRRQRRRGESPLEEEGEAAWAQCLAPNPAEQLLVEERAGLVRQAVMGLPETHRAVVVLRQYEGLKLREIAEVLGIPEGTVKSRLADALTQLAHRLKPLLGEEEPGRQGETEATQERLVL